MIEAYAIADVRAAEQAARADLPDGELMARAAQGLAEVVAARLRERGSGRVVGLVGPGDNGGDALYALAHLAERGASVTAVHGAAVHGAAVHGADERAGPAAHHAVPQFAAERGHVVRGVGRGTAAAEPTRRPTPGNPRSLTCLVPAVHCWPSGPPAPAARAPAGAPRFALLPPPSP